jgi:hypothetical protein
VTVLEASAGTGKTYHRGAHGATSPRVPLERLLLVTFTRIATGGCASGCASGWSASSAGSAGLAGAPATDDEDPS